MAFFVLQETLCEVCQTSFLDKCALARIGGIQYESSGLSGKWKNRYGGASDTEASGRK